MRKARTAGAIYSAGEKQKGVRLSLGADDYVTKPFSFQSFARVQAMLRRAKGGDARDIENAVRSQTVSIDTRARSVRKAETEVALTPKSSICCGIVRRRGAVASRPSF